MGSSRFTFNASVSLVNFSRASTWRIKLLRWPPMPRQYASRSMPKRWDIEALFISAFKCQKKKWPIFLLSSERFNRNRANSLSKYGSYFKVCTSCSRNWLSMSLLKHLSSHLRKETTTGFIKINSSLQNWTGGSRYQMTVQFAISFEWETNLTASLRTNGSAYLQSNSSRAVSGDTGGHTESSRKSCERNPVNYTYSQCWTAPFHVHWLHDFYLSNFVSVVPLDSIEQFGQSVRNFLTADVSQLPQQIFFLLWQFTQRIFDVDFMQALRLRSVDLEKLRGLFRRR